MSAASARWFSWVQGAGFYSDHLRDAVALLPPGDGRTFLDMGCGPGLMTRLAAAHGYRAVGIDVDQAMVATARRAAHREGSTATFERGDLHASALRPVRADVVAAASLLAVARDRPAALQALWHRVATGGLLLVVEATEEMTAPAARRLIADGLPGPRARILAVWASVRENRTVDPGIYWDLAGVAETRVVPLLHGLAGAWLIRKQSVADPVRQ